MSDNGFASRGTLYSLQDRRGEYHYLNTIIEEAASDASPAVPARSSQSTLPVKLHQQRVFAQRQRQQQQQQQQQQRLRENAPRRTRDGRQDEAIEMWLSPMSDHFPTPRGFHFLSAPILPSSPSSTSIDHEADFGDDDSSPDTCSPLDSWTQRNSISTATEFDDIYDASDDDSSVRKQQPTASSIARQLSVSRRSTSRSASRTPSLDASHRSSADRSDETRKMLPQLTIPNRPSPMSLTDPDPKLCASPMAPTPSAQVPMSPAMMSFMEMHQALEVPTVSAPPSLDGSLTSEQMSQMSAHTSSPPTPIIGAKAGENEAASAWNGVQLQPGALATLQSLARSDAGSVVDGGNLEAERVIEVPTESQEPMAEMSENQTQQPLRLITAGVPRHTMPFSPAQQRSLAGLTRLEIPSPGGFFSGLSPRTRHTWHIPGMTPVDSAQPPTSGTAERFYRLPWADAAPLVPPVPERPLHMPGADLSSSPVEQVVEVATPVKTEDPTTAFRVQTTPLTAQRILPAQKPSVLLDMAESSSPVEEVVATEIVNDYLAIDAEKLQLEALANLDRTGMWLEAQRAYLNGIADMTEAPEDITSPSPDDEPPSVPPKDKLPGATTAPAPAVSVPSSATSTTLVSKKTVRFSEATKSPSMPRTLPSKLLHVESAYYRAFCMQSVRTNPSDAFVNRMPRFEALQSQRLLLREAHRNQLLGKYQLNVVPQSAKKRMSANVVRGDDNLVDDPTKLRADKEADALEQMAPTAWNVAALKMLNGGRLITAPVHKRLARLSRMAPGPHGLCRDRARILDLGGQATCDWAWHTALQYPNTKVYSVTTKAIRQLSNANIRGPPNHRQVAVERLTRLPFDDDQFDLVRATELYSILKFVGENGEDEWESCLNECYRVLKPGGYLEFNVLDADLVNAGPLGNAKSVEFGFSLQTLGYDPAPTKMFLGRLERAGFANVRRAWMCLPVGPAPRLGVLPKAPRDSTTGELIPTADLDAMVYGATDHVAAVTGLLGSWSWERWLLRAEMEKTAGNLRLADTVTVGSALSEAGKSLDGVHAILEEGRVTGAAWRMLRGYARKPRSDMGTINMMLDMGW